jgi:hypothetical protein
VSKAVHRPTWWTRAESLTWIMTRRLSATADPGAGDGSTLPINTPWAQRDPQATRPMDGVIEDTLRRMQAPTGVRSLPKFADAFAALAAAEENGLVPNSSGLFRSAEIKKLWPSPYGRGGGVAPRQWDKRILEKLAGKFAQAPRDMTREDLMAWTGNVPFNDPEKWTGYVRRAMAKAIIDVLLRRQCRCAGDGASAECIKEFGRRFCLTREEGAAMLTNVWSWRADGPLPPGN